MKLAAVTLAKDAIWDHNNSCILATGDGQLLECHRRIVQDQFEHDIAVYDRQDMMSFLGLTELQLRQLANTLIALSDAS